MTVRSTVTVVTPPTGQVVTTDELKVFARIDGDDEDALLDGFIEAATICAEDYTRRSFLTRTLRASIDAACGRSPWFPGSFELPVDYFDPAVPDRFELPRGPIQSVVSATTYDRYGSATVYPADDYTLVNGHFTLSPGSAWPSLLRPSGGIEITYLAGYGEDVPRPIRTAILMHAASLYETRGQCGCDAPPAGCMMMLRQYRVMDL